MRILVTGANGLLGQKLCELIVRNGSHSLVATARKPLTYPLANHHFHTLDVADATQVDNVIGSARPDVVIHTAAMTQVDHCEMQRDECWKQNVTAVANVVGACEKNNAHLVHVSTDFIFDGSHGPLTEEEAPGPVNFYGESKLAGEQLVRKCRTPWAILRTVLVFGVTPDMSRSNIVLWVKKSLDDGKSIQVVNDQWRTPTLAEDLAMGCFLAATQRAEGVFNISGAEMMTPYDVAIATAEYFKLDKSLIKATDSTQFRQPAARPLKTGFVIDKAKRVLGYQPHSFKEGLQLLASQIPSN